MRGIEIPLQDFALKMHGGGLFAGHYGTYMYAPLKALFLFIVVYKLLRNLAT